MNESGLLRRMELSATPLAPRPKNNDNNNTGLVRERGEGLINSWYI